MHTITVTAPPGHTITHMPFMPTSTVTAMMVEAEATLRDQGWTAAHSTSSRSNLPWHPCIRCHKVA